MGGITIGGGGFTAADQEKLNKRMADKAKAEYNQDQTNADVKTVKDYLYYGKDQTVGKDKPYSRFRNESGRMARERLDERGVDTDSLITGNPSANEDYKKGGKITHYKSAADAVKAAQKRGDKSITVKFNQSKASKRADGIATKGFTKGRYL